MELSKYQWFQEQPQSECGFCDRLLYASNTGEIGDTIQVAVTNGNEYTEDLSSNPFPYLNSTSITFKITEPLPYGTIQIYIEDKIYIVVISSSDIFDHYSLESSDGTIFYYIVYGDSILGAGYTLEDNMLAFLTEVIDANHSTTSTYNGGTGVFTISDIYNPVYFNVENNVLNTVTGVDTSYVDSYYMYWNAGKICMYDVPGVEVPSYTFIAPTLSAGIDYIITIPYTTLYSNFEYQITITNGITPTVVSGVFTNVNGSIVINYTAPTSGTYTFAIEVTERNGNTEGLCLETITVNYIDSIEYVTIEDCNGNEQEMDWTVTYYNDTAIIRLDTDNYGESTLPDVFRITIEDQNNFKIISRWYELYDSTNCEHQKYTKINWSNSCQLGDLLYQNGLSNELYFSGVMIKQGLEIHDSADNVTADGRKISVFKITQPAYELRLAPYLSETMDMIERIFEHDTVLINDVEYNATDVFQVSELDMGVYTGRVDLLKSGDSLVSVKCCS